MSTLCASTSHTTNVVTCVFLLFLVCCLPTYISPANILGFFPTFSSTTLYLHGQIAELLARSGHNVTVIGTIPNPVKNATFTYKEIKFSKSQLQRLNSFKRSPRTAYWEFFRMLGNSLLVSNATFMHPQMQKWMKDAKEEDFDLLIFGYFLNDFQMGLASLYKCPIIISTTTAPTFWINRLVDNPAEASYVPSALTPYYQRMDILDTLVNFWIVMLERTYFAYVVEKENNRTFCQEMHTRRLCRQLGLLLSVLLLGGCNAFQRYTDTVHGKILCIFATYNVDAFRYHMLLASFLARSHNVTIVGVLPLPPNYHLPNFNYVHIEPEGVDLRRPSSGRFVKIFNQMKQYAELGKQIRRFLEDYPPGTFDLVILAYFYSPKHLLLAGCYRVPIILTTETGPSFITNWEVGNPNAEDYLISEFSDIRIQPQSYLESLMYLIVDISIQFMFSAENIAFQLLNQNTISHFNCQNLQLSKVRQNISLVFTNHHFTQGPIRPNVPVIVEIGGIQIPEQLMPLPQQVADHISKAEKGFIYINLGKTGTCTHLPQAVLDGLFDALVASELHVLWRWTHCTKSRPSPKILYSRWMPQNEILAEKNAKLFITHGSLSSLAEGQYHAVPMLAITYLSEQVGNVQYLAQYQLARRIDAYHTNANIIRRTLNHMLKEQSYKARIDLYSRVYRDRPLSPRETVLYWVNYVIRYQGTPHMRSPAMDMNQLQLAGVDMILITVFIILLIWKLRGFLWYCLTGRIIVIFSKFLRKCFFGRDYEIVVQRASSIRYDNSVVDMERECQIRPQDPDIPRIIPVKTARQRRVAGGRRR